MYVCMHACMHVCVYVCMYVVYIHNILTPIQSGPNSATPQTMARGETQKFAEFHISHDIIHTTHSRICFSFSFSFLHLANQAPIRQRNQSPIADTAGKSARRELARHELDTCGFRV